MSETWWVLAGLSAVDPWTDGEESRAVLSQQEARRTLPRSQWKRLATFSVDWDDRADAQLIREIRSGDCLIAIVQHADRRWYVSPAAEFIRKDTLWRPSMRRTSMLTVVCPTEDLVAPLARVRDALAESGVTVRSAGK